MCRIIQAESKKRPLSLEEIMNELGDEVLKSILSSFSCTYDEDIQNFLHNRAIEFERLLKSRTYLIVSDEQIRNPKVAFDEITIYGYISLAVKVLIGQLARNSNVPKESISGAELLTFAYKTIGEAVKLVGGRNILVECRNNEKLIQFYLNNGFYKVSQVPDKNQSMIQMIRRIEFGGYAS